MTTLLLLLSLCFSAQEPTLAIDETAELNAAIRTAAEKGETCNISAGAHWVNPEIGLQPQSGSRIVLHPKAVIQALPVASGSSGVFILDGVANVTIVGGTVRGERAGHLGTDGEWGMGFKIINSQRVAIRGVTVQECWGDGFYVAESQDVTLQTVRSEHNRRQGLSIVSGERITVRGSVFERTDGTAPQSGIAIEPNAGSVVQDVQIVNCVCIGNNGRGVQCVVPHALVGQATVQRVQIDRCTIADNGCDVPAYGLEIANTVGVTVSDCLVRNNRGIGIGSVKTIGTTVSGCTVRGTFQTSNKSDAGVMFSEDQQSHLIGNRIVENETIGLFLHQSSVNAMRNTIVRNNRR